MDDKEFAALAERTLAQVLERLEASGADLDCAMVGDGVLEIEFENGAKMVINRHAAAQEIWVATRDGGFHYRWNGQEWIGTRDATELLADLSKFVSTQAAVRVDLRGD